MRSQRNDEDKSQTGGEHEMKKTITGLIAATMLATPALAADVNLRAIGIVSTHKHLTELERSFYDGLAETTGIDITVNFNPLDVVGVNMQDTLRLVRSGTFDIVETTIGSAARDDPFVEGLDLIGVSPDMDTLEDTVNVYREVFAERMAEKFNAHVLALWPFGPQMFYCSDDVKSLDDLAGKKVRSYTPTMSALVESLGASPVTLQFAEVPGPAARRCRLRDHLGHFGQYRQLAGSDEKSDTARHQLVGAGPFHEPGQL
jgi:TRAP-type C4-dicarboxylate transport system substrate-binding protein